MVHPRETVTFEEFEQRTPGPAVALDGYVIGPTRWSPSGTHASFDHHADVDRFSTRATCEQVALALRSRFALVTGDGGRPRDELTVHVNDPDPDASLSWWLLCHPALVDHPAVLTLVDLEGAVDSSGGTAAPGDPAVLEVLAWVGEPLARRRDDVANMTAEEMAEVIAECAERMDAVVAGRPGRVPLSSSYETRAEVRIAASMGADIVGMSTVPEVIAARHCGLEVAAFSLVTNMAAGVTPAALSHDEVTAVGAERSGEVVEFLTRYTSALTAPDAD